MRMCRGEDSFMVDIRQILATGKSPLPPGWSATLIFNISSAPILQTLQ